MKRTKQTQFGFTLIEIILYLGIMMVIVGSVSAFSALLLSARAKAHTILEVEQQGTAILQLMSATIRGSDGINAPQALNTSNLTVTELLFSNATPDGAPGSVKFEFTITHLNPENRNEYNYVKT